MPAFILGRSSLELLFDCTWAAGVPFQFRDLPSLAGNVSTSV